MHLLILCIFQSTYGILRPDMSELIQRKKIIQAWCMYDWANSVYNLVIVSAIFPMYYEAITTIKDGNKVISDQVTLLGMQFTNTALADYAMSFSFLIVAILSPILSGIADYSGRRKLFLRIFCFLGATACAGLYFFDRSHLGYGIICMMLASIGFWGSLVFYNSFLPDIVSREQMDKVSARGFAYGYLGSSVLLMLSFVFISSADSIGLTTGEATRLVFVGVGIWWVSFAQFLFFRVPEKKAKTSIHGLMGKGYQELRRVWEKLKQMPSARRFLSAFFFFNMGVQTVMIVAAYFGSKLLGLPSSILLPIILVIQFVGIGGSFLFATISGRKGNVFGLRLAIIIWLLVCAGAYTVAEFKSEFGFYGLAFMVGLVMGGIQSLSRATYGKLISDHQDDHASFFSFYDVTEKISLVFGLFAFGYIEELSGSMQNSVLALMIFFALGLLLLYGFKDARLMPVKTQKSE